MLHHLCDIGDLGKISGSIGKIEPAGNYLIFIGGNIRIKNHKHSKQSILKEL